MEAVSCYKLGADYGDAGAQFSLALCYHFGRGVDVDPVKAIEWYTKAANQGHAMAQNNLGECYKGWIWRSKRP